MKAPIKAPIALETGSEAGQSSLEALLASHRRPFNRIDTALLTVTNRAKALAFLAFSAAS